MSDVKREVVVSLGSDADHATVVEALTRAGMSVRDVLSEIGIVTGHAALGDFGRLKSVPGVTDVSDSHAATTQTSPG